MAKKAYQNNPKVLGLDVSTKTLILFAVNPDEQLCVMNGNSLPNLKVTFCDVKEHPLDGP